ncbi:cellulase family glycosylhydrolase [Microbacterium sp. MYb64]|uniref:glycoside hydrolase family 5 protein n=1 Tax=Microbacterium sp. MYb64 TaxID=1848691 RepID=UPI000CFE35A3|nr:cellulase family glycosylhydrolase [Microbacterium sp. MYb64]PRB09165.1 hypothetical protein CQ044_02120 [Microbacterium sp. MYb64]
MRSRRWRFGVAAVLAGILTGAGTASAGAAAEAKPAPDPFGIPSAIRGPISKEGRWLVDGTGRVVQFHGFDLMHRLPPYTPEPFGAQDAQWLADQGFNSMRLGVMYEAVEPELDTYDDAYIASMVGTNRMLSEHGFFNTIDFHNDVFARQFNGDGFPHWAVPSDSTMEASWKRVADTPAFQEADDKYSWQAQYNPLERHAWDHFWTNAPLPNGVGLQDQFVAAWKHVAEAFRGDQNGLLGYSPLNEPLNGNCVQPLCDHIPDQRLPFYEKWLAAVRSVDADRTAYLASDLWFAGTYGQDPDTNVRTILTGIDDPAIAIERHNYAFGADQVKQYVHDDELADELATPFVVNEFFAGFGPASKAAIDVDLAGAHDQSWMMWSYYAEPDICCAASGFLVDQSLPASDTNAKTDVADALITPYPQAIAGTPGSHVYDRSARTLTFDYATAPVGAARSSDRTVVFIPQRVYRTGYTVKADGAKVVSAPTSPWLVLENAGNAERVEVTISPASDSMVLPPSDYCAKNDCAVDGPGDAGAGVPGAPSGPQAGGAAQGAGSIPLAMTGLDGALLLAGAVSGVIAAGIGGLLLAHARARRRAGRSA